MTIRLFKTYPMLRFVCTVPINTPIDIDGCVSDSIRWIGCRHLGIVIGTILPIASSQRPTPPLRGHHPVFSEAHTPDSGRYPSDPSRLRGLASDLPDPTRGHHVSAERFLLDVRALPSRAPIHTGMRYITMGVDVPPVPHHTVGICSYTDASLPSLYDIWNDGHGVFSMIVWKIHSV